MDTEEPKTLLEMQLRLSEEAVRYRLIGVQLESSALRELADSLSECARMTDIIELARELNRLHNHHGYRQMVSTTPAREKNFHGEAAFVCEYLHSLTRGVRE
jgi:hypothetical protein